MLTIKNCLMECVLVTHSHLQTFSMAQDVIATENNCVPHFLNILFVE